MASGLSRVTVVGPRSRIDLALPSDIPLADLLPTLLRYVDAEHSSIGTPSWTLSRLGGTLLDTSYTPAQLDVHDGELLYLRPRGDEAPVLVFDDVVDAVATAAQGRAGRWSPATTRVFGLTVGVLAMLGGAVAALLAGPPHLAGGLAGLATAAVLLVVAVVLARAVGDSRAATVFALAAAAFAAVGGLLVLAGDRTLGQLAWPHLVVAATAVLLVAAVGAVGVPAAAPVFLTVGVCAVALHIAAAMALGLGADVAAAAAGTVTLVLATVPALPMLAYRLGGLPIPALPAQREELRRDDDAVDGERVLSRSDRADTFLAAMLTAVGVIGACAGVAVCTGGRPGIALATVLGLLMLTRARWFGTRAQRLPFLASGMVALTAAAVAVFASAGQSVRLPLGLGVAAVIAAAGAGFGLAGARRPTSPLWGRALDIGEVLLIVALVPLAAWVCDLYAWIRSVRG